MQYNKTAFQYFKYLFLPVLESHSFYQNKQVSFLCYFLKSKKIKSLVLFINLSED